MTERDPNAVYIPSKSHGLARETWMEYRSDLIYWPYGLIRLGSQDANKDIGPMTGSNEFLLGWIEGHDGTLMDTVIAGSYYGTSTDSVNGLLNKLKSKYSCRAKIKSSITDECKTTQHHYNNCGKCYTCTCIQQLKVVAALKADSNINQYPHYQNIQLLIDHQQIGCIPTFYQSSTLDNSTYSPPTFKQSLSLPYTVVYQILPFSPHRPRSSLGHYSLNEGQQSDFDLIESSHSSEIYRRQLLRISEVANIIHELGCLMDQEKVDNHDNRVDPNFTRVEEEKEGNVLLKFPSSINYLWTPALSMLCERSLLFYIITTRKRFITINPRRSINTTIESNDYRNSTGSGSLLPLISALYQFWTWDHKVTTDPTSFVPREIQSKLYHIVDHAMIQDFVDGLLGLIVGVLIVVYKESLISAGGHIWYIIHHQLLRNNISWLESAPLGVKLNIPLTAFFGKSIRLVLDVFESTWIFLIQHIDIVNCVQGLGFISIIFGFTFIHTIVFDIIRLFWLHVYFFYRIFQALYQCELILISSLTNLFRGRKKNILRQRFDTCESDYMQLLVASIMFAMTLFFYTTFLVYYTFFTAIYIAAQSFLVFICVAFMTVQVFPFGNILSRIAYPERHIQSIYFSQAIPAEESSNGMISPTKFHVNNNMNLYRYNLILRAKPVRLSSTISWQTSKYISLCARVTKHLILDIFIGKRVSLAEELLKICKTSLNS